MRPDERQERILQYLKEKESASLEELTQVVHCSLSTVRRDVDELALQCLLRRTHGGARITNPGDGINLTHIPNISTNVGEKEAIARCCANMIRPGQTVIIDEGSTAYYVARQLASKHPVIITNSLAIIGLYAFSNQAEVHVAGGIIYPRLGLLTGSNAVRNFSHIHADVAIMGAAALSLEDGVSNIHALSIETQIAMLGAADKNIFCLDSSKLGRHSLCHLCSVERIHTLITDEKADPAILEELRRRGVIICIAKY